MQSLRTGAARARMVAVMVAMAVGGGVVSAPPAWARRPPTTTTTRATTTTVPSTTTTTTPTTTHTPGGYDISWPQCGTSYPTNPAFGIVGASNGLAYSDNPCLASEYAWAAMAARAPAFYVNTADPGSQSTHWTTPGPKSCGGSSTDLGCAYNYGWNAVAHALAYAAAQTAGATSDAWWLDIETANTWSTVTAVNNADIGGMVDYFHSRSLTVGVYSTSYQWGQITGGASLAVPDWVAGASSVSQASSWCTPSYSFTGGAVRLVQYPSGSFDGNVAC
ncbi:MAG TPA: hypothetical protein VHT75_12255 [Acidimicrobiales bacterium]|nr:hypothetical protein [Acidimicrobiales bacterium]